MIFKKNVQNIFIVAAHVQNIIEFQLIFLLSGVSNLNEGKWKLYVISLFLLSLQEMKIGCTGNTPRNPIG